MSKINKEKRVLIVMILIVAANGFKPLNSVCELEKNVYGGGRGQALIMRITGESGCIGNRADIKVTNEYHLLFW